jgi:hypothetical protein
MVERAMVGFASISEDTTGAAAGDFFEDVAVPSYIRS